MTSSPLLHFVLEHLDESKMQSDATLQFFQYLTNDIHLDFDDQALDGNGEKAGKAHPEKAFKLLCAACSKGEINVANCLLSAGVDPNQCDSEDLSPLSHSAMAGHRAVMGMLLQWGSLVNCVSSTRRQTALMSSVEANQLESVAFLTDIGADPNIANSDGSTPLILASEMGNLQIVEVLLQMSADPNHCDSHGWSSLSKACDKGYSEIAFVLVQAGANVLQNNGRIPIQIAVEKKLVSFVTYNIRRKQKVYEYISENLSSQCT